MAGRIKPGKAEYMYYCPNKERSWAKDGGSATPWQRGTGCGFERAMNIPATDKLVFDTVVSLHRGSSVLKEEIKKQILKAKGITAPPSEAEIKEIQKQMRRHERAHKDVQEAIGQLEANRYLKNMEDVAYKAAFKKMTDEADRLKGILADLRRRLEGEAEKKQWVDWVALFGEELDEKRKLTDVQRQQYLAGLIEKIECRFLPETRDHELTIHFNHPIVGDKVKWKDPKKKSLGYQVIQGSKETRFRVEKRDARGK